MMKKVIKKLLAALLAVAMVCAMAIPAFAYDTEEVRAHHSFEAFQIFQGDVSDDNTKISNVKWGKNITNSTDFLEKLTADPTISGEFNNPTTAQDVLAVISKWHDSDDNSIAFARFVCHYLYSGAVDPGTSIPSSGDVVEIPEDGAGYYLIVDTTDFSTGDSYHAYNSFLLKVNKGKFNLPIKPKFVKPTVEKKVYDNDNNDISSAGGWGSSADHAINEKFKFQLIAKLPASSDRAYDYYDNYTVRFTDTLSEGITFDNLDTVEITNGDGGASQVITDTDYTLVKDLHEAGLPSSITLSIDNVKTCVPDLNKGATITVTYTAHLNDKAYVNTGSGSTENKNSVQLQYSNNPRPGEYWGTTPKSEVYVYTYQLNNTKRAETENGTPLPGAGFRLYSDADYKNEVKLYQDGEFYYPIKDATDKNKEAVEMKSAANGQFNVKGLDAGTYYLKETTTPADFTPCSVIPPVTITANHNGNHVELDSSKLSTTIINKKAGGITLPSTGGIGTTIFYVVGGGLMVAAIVLLVTKKRMENK